MTTSIWIMFAAMVTAVLTGVALARRQRAYAPVPIAFGLLVLASAAQAVLGAALSPPSAEPWQGTKRVLVYFDGAAQLASGAAVPGLALAVFLTAERRRRGVALVVVAWILASVVLAALYPSPLVRGDGLQRIYIGADLAGVSVAMLALARWIRWAYGRGVAAPEHIVAMGLIVLDLAILLSPYSPWRGSVFDGRFDGVQLIITLSFAMASIAQVVLWSSSAG